jgi:contactin associated protein-like 2
VYFQFNGNTDRDTVVENEFQAITTAQYVRIYPTAWNEFVSMRFELGGCYL